MIDCSKTDISSFFSVWELEYKNIDNDAVKNEIDNLKNNPNFPMTDGLSYETYNSIAVKCCSEKTLEKIAEKYYKKSLEINNTNNHIATINIANYYDEYGVKNEVLKYINQLYVSEIKTMVSDEINNNADIILNTMGCLYVLHDDFIKALDCWKIAGNIDHVHINSGIYYLHYDLDSVKMKFHFSELLTCECDNRKKACAHCNLAYYYGKYEINYQKMIEHYEQAVNLGDSGAMFMLGYIYDEKSPHHEKFKKFGDKYNYLKDEQLSQKYYKLALEEGNKYALEKFEKSMSYYEYYLCLTTIDNPCKMIGDKIQTVKTNRKLADLLFRLQVAEKYAIIENCPVCLEMKSCVLQSCCHSICAMCFSKIDRCPVCNKIYSYANG